MRFRALGFLVLLTFALFAAPLAAEAQQAAKVARIGFLWTNPGGLSSPLLEAFLQGLRDLGYVEGRNLVIEYRDAEGKYERFPALAAELVALKVDVIVAPGTLHALAAKQATGNLPIVFIGAGDPVTSGLVTSLARPGGNVTGSSNLAPELVGKCPLVPSCAPALVGAPSRHEPRRRNDASTAMICARALDRWPPRRAESGRCLPEA